jgi:hypothetical protein
VIYPWAKLSLASENVGRSRRQIGVKNVKKCISSGNMAAGKMFHPHENSPPLLGQQGGYLSSGLLLLRLLPVFLFLLFVAVLPSG